MSQTNSLPEAIEAILRIDRTLIERPQAFYAALCDTYDSEQRTTEMRVLGDCMDERLLDPFAAVLRCDWTSAPSQLKVAENNAIDWIIGKCPVESEAASYVAQRLAHGIELYLGMAKTRTLRSASDSKITHQPSQDPQPQVHTLTRVCASCGRSMDKGDNVCPFCGPGTLVDVLDENGRVVNSYRTTTGGSSVGKTDQPRVLFAMVCVLAVLIAGGLAVYFSSNAGNPKTTAQSEESTDSDSKEPIGEPPKRLFSAGEFPRTWYGTYDGYSEYVEGNTIVREIAMSFTQVGENGDVVVTCSVDGGGTGSGTASGTYEANGTINWETGYIRLQGTKWIDQGDLLGMGGFKGTIDPSSWTVVGGTWFDPEGEAKDGGWRMSAK